VIWCPEGVAVTLIERPDGRPSATEVRPIRKGANALAKRPRNLWRRPGSSFRLGQSKPVVGNLDEQRITLYLPAFVLDQAEIQAARAGVPTIQQYCARLLRDAIEDARRLEQAAEDEARRGALIGFHAITEDPEYLVEWSASATPRDRGEIQVVEALDQPQQADAMPEPPSQAAQVVLRHAAVGSDDPAGFLATIRRGESVPETAAQELLQAIHALEVEYRDARTIDRKVAYALHRLAFEGQILHTDAWPGAFDEGTVNLLRIVQEAVDRVLSGEDIRYYPPGA
jgi:hypothetical protein